MPKISYPQETGAGVYEILCNVTQKVYIGSSRNIRKRLHNHINSLRKGVHHSTHLQRAWDKYGEDNFELGILEKFTSELGDAEQVEREQYWLDHKKCYEQKYGYNILRQAFSLSGFKMSDETKQLQQESALKRPRKSDDERLAIKVRLQGSKSHFAILNDSLVAKIKTRLVEGERPIVIAREFGLSISAISRIRNGKNWAHVLPHISEMETMRKGDKHHKAKLTAQQVSDIKQKLRSGVPIPVLAVEASVSVCTIHDIQKERTWKQVQ